MMRLMIVDDERAVHEAIRLLVDVQRLQIKEIRSAYSAEEALTLIEKEAPDVMLVDMKMPHTDGVALMHSVHSRNSAILFIVISGYDLFEYTRPAIQMNAVDYLLKPLERGELNAALEKAYFALNRQHEQHQQMDYFQSVLKPMERDLMLREALFTTESNGVPDPELLPEPFHNDSFYRGLCVCFPLNGAEVCEQSFENSDKLFRKAICDALNSHINRWAFCYVLCAEPILMNFAIFIAVPSCANPEAYVYQHIESDLKTIHQRLGIQMIMQMGNLSTGPIDSNHEYQYLCGCLDDLNLMGVSSYLLAKNVSGSNRMFDLGFYEKKILLERSFQQKDPVSTMNIVDAFFARIEDNGVFSRKIADWIMSVWSMELKNLQSKYGFVSLTPGKRVMESELRRNSYELPVLHHLIRLIVSDAMQAYIQTSPGCSGYAPLIKQYIDEYYFSDINLTQISSQFHISKNHLSKIFKSAYGIGIYEYYLDVRMKHAAEMLKDPSIKVRFIAERLCFSDSNYFSKAFKHYYGMTPSEYRDNIQQ